MNERIRKIESQAWGQVKRTNGLVRTEDFNEKFAELIVRECIGVCEEYHGTAGDQAARYIGQGINEHFGVEE
jgi:hypothetical protein